MFTHIVVSKRANENGTSLIRRFSKLVRSSNIVSTVKGRRYYSRADSPLRKKLGAVRRIALTAQYEKLKKLGKVSDGTERGGDSRN